MGAGRLYLGSEQLGMAALAGGLNRGAHALVASDGAADTAGGRLDPEYQHGEAQGSRAAFN